MLLMSKAVKLATEPRRTGGLIGFDSVLRADSVYAPLNLVKRDGVKREDVKREGVKRASALTGSLSRFTFHVSAGNHG